jgi:hypothetical protein
MNKSGWIAICASAVASLAVLAQSAAGQTVVPAELQEYYDSNAAAIKDIIATAEDPKAPIDARRTAFERLRIGYPRAALDPAIKLSTDENLVLAVDGTTFLSSAVVMMNHGATLDSHDAHSGDQSVPRAVAALRKSSLDARSEVREIAAASLASLSDETTLKALELSYKNRKVSDIEVLRYITLAKPSVGAEYAAAFLGSGSVKAQSEAISYLSSSEQYHGKIKGYLLDEKEPVEIRAAAAKGLARNDPAFGSYAPALVANSKLPAPVFSGLVSEMSPKLSSTVVKDVLSKALQAPLDRTKYDTMSKSIILYESLRPEIDVGPLQGSLKRLNPT